MLLKLIFFCYSDRRSSKQLYDNTLAMFEHFNGFDLRKNNLKNAPMYFFVRILNTNSNYCVIMTQILLIVFSLVKRFPVEADCGAMFSIMSIRDNNLFISHNVVNKTKRNPIILGKGNLILHLFCSLFQLSYSTQLGT